ncbi:hypothetical protein ACFST9_00040 [Hymenobacter monticola]|uniref:Uncharacterized protein n=1 Tax=Hymenobacter monticola TaxID=1705399 RepID=A0ABY4BC89_9BACT|nr:hypothetical protein [Hymenobacter monticola]UOE36770.1 hypothetical protein MTP16_25570 [Hymenobacter monticola]
MIRYRFVDVPFQGHTIRYVRESRRATDANGHAFERRPKVWNDDRVEELIAGLEHDLGSVVIVDRVLSHVASLQYSDIVEAFLQQHGRLTELNQPWQYTAYRMPTPVTIQYKDVKWRGLTVRLIHILNEPGPWPAFFGNGSVPDLDPNHDAAAAITAEVQVLFQDDKVKTYVESTRFYFEPIEGLEDFKAYDFEDDPTPATTITLNAGFR